jgi:hypothetical protein
LSGSAIEKDVYTKVLDSLKSIISSSSPEDLSKQVGSALLKNSDMEDIVLKRNIDEYSINSVLYGSFAAPSQARKIYLNRKVMDLEGKLGIKNTATPATK